MLKRQASAESLRELQWEEEFEKRQEQLRLEAKEELRVRKIVWQLSG